jgi:hypothetical protein
MFYMVNFIIFRLFWPKADFNSLPDSVRINSSICDIFMEE